jgi:UDP-GlcNAc:undecaprenyl-phosphate/decaprenyl-phosphate GlcNAc-1-phosphate transferase
MYLTVSFCVAMISCFLTIRWLRLSGLAKAVIDIPNHRSLHTHPTPKVGGIGIATGILSSLLITCFYSQIDLKVLLPTFVAFGAFVGISVLDDARQLTVKVRLSFHLLVVLIWILWSFSVSPSSVLRQLPPLNLVASTLLITLGIVWATNLFNFMDGSDGLAGSMALLGFAAYSIAASLAGDYALVSICICVCGSTIGFLYFNWPVAKVFLGDSGSIPLGFLAASIGTYGVFQGSWPADFPLMLFAMFWIDATCTLVTRSIRGRKLSEAHRDHWYQKAIKGGSSHQKVLVIHLICNFIICGLALYSLKFGLNETISDRALIILIVIAIALGFGFWAEIKYKNFRSIQFK